MKEMLKDFFIRNVAERNLIQGIALHEFVEYIGAENHSLRNHHAGILIFIKVSAALDDIIEESETSAFASQRSFTDAGELTVGIVSVSMENGNYTLILHPSVAHDSIKNILTVCIHITLHLPCDFLQKLCHREYGT